MIDDSPARVVMITGGARRVGAEVARCLHAAGMDIVLHYRRSVGPAEALATELQARRPGSVLLVSGDLLDLDIIPGLIEQAVTHFGRLDFLVNNASSFYPTPMGQISAADWDDLIGSNLRAPLFLSQAAAPHLARAGGAIVNMVDIHAERPLKDHIVYGIAKAGVAMLTRTLALELAPEVRCNGIAPGAILWPEAGLDDAAQALMLARIPLARRGEPADIAATILFLLRDAAYITGQVIAVDGGRSMVA
jgi:pteridine reductase